MMDAETPLLLGQRATAPAGAGRALVAASLALFAAASRSSLARARRARDGRREPSRPSDDAAQGAPSDAPADDAAQGAPSDDASASIASAGSTVSSTGDDAAPQQEEQGQDEQAAGRRVDRAVERPDRAPVGGGAAAAAGAGAQGQDEQRGAAAGPGPAQRSPAALAPLGSRRRRGRAGTQYCNESISKLAFSVSEPAAAHAFVSRYFPVTCEANGGFDGLLALLAQLEHAARSRASRSTAPSAAAAAATTAAARARRASASTSCTRARAAARPARRRARSSAPTRSRRPSLSDLRCARARSRGRAQRAGRRARGRASRLLFARSDSEVRAPAAHGADVPRQRGPVRRRARRTRSPRSREDGGPASACRLVRVPDKAGDADADRRAATHWRAARRAASAQRVPLAHRRVPSSGVASRSSRRARPARGAARARPNHAGDAAAAPPAARCRARARRASAGRRCC